MLTAVIIEDLNVAAEYLKHCCSKSGKVEVLACFTTIGSALTYLNENRVDVVFLDIEMQEEVNGFDLLDRLAYSPKVILTTGNPEYAYNAFEYNVSDFLKKPYTYQRFLNAVEKITASAPVKEESAKEDDHFYIKTDGKLIRLMNDDILYIESMGDYVRFVTSEKKYISHNTIKWLEEKMNASMFLKVHRSYIVNIKKVSNIRENMLYINNQEIPISKANRPEVMKRINIL